MRIDGRPISPFRLACNFHVSRDSRALSKGLNLLSVRSKWIQVTILAALVLPKTFMPSGTVTDVLKVLSESMEAQLLALV